MQPTPSYVPPHGLLKGKTLLVTAAAGAGIGFAVARRALEEGCSALLISDAHERRLGEAMAGLRRDFPNADVHGQLCDISQQSHVDALFGLAQDKMGGIDVLINNAGLGTSRRIVDMSDDEWDKVIAVTLTGTFRMIRGALKLMQPRGRGVIVNNASVLGWRAQVEQGEGRGRRGRARRRCGRVLLLRRGAARRDERGARLAHAEREFQLRDGRRVGAARRAEGEGRERLTHCGRGSAPSAARSGRESATAHAQPALENTLRVPPATGDRGDRRIFDRRVLTRPR